MNRSCGPQPWRRTPSPGTLTAMIGTDALTIRAPEAATLAAVTYRQLDYWARTGIVVPSIAQARGSGSQRLYSPRDVLKLRVVSRLLTAGVKLSTIRQAIKLIDAAPQVARTLIIHADRALASETETPVLDYLSTGAVVIALSIERMAIELDADLLELNAVPR